MFYASEKPMSFQRQNSLREVPPLTKLPIVDKLQGLHAIIHRDTSLGPIRLRGTRNASCVTAPTGNNVIWNADSLHSLLIIIYENSDERTVSRISCSQSVSKGEAHECCIINRLAAITIKSPPQPGLTFKKVPEMSYRNLNRMIQKYGINKIIEEGRLQGASKRVTLKRENAHNRAAQTLERIAE